MSSRGSSWRLWFSWLCVGWIGPIVGGDYLLSQAAAAAVDVFIILSGFAITRLLIVGRESGARYIWRRICRIFPAYWAALLAGIALNAWLQAICGSCPGAGLSTSISAFARWAAPGFGSMDHPRLSSPRPGPDVMAASRALYPLGVAWSLSLEWQFYLVAPFAVRVAISSKLGFALVVCRQRGRTLLRKNRRSIFGRVPARTGPVTFSSAVSFVWP